MNRNASKVAIEDYVIASEKAGHGLKKCSLTIGPGEVVYLESSDPADGLLLLRALATLEKPDAGRYFFLGHEHRTDDYRDLLECKRRISYIAQDASLISNLSIRENLLLMKWYFGNSFSIGLGAEEKVLCQLLDLERKIELRPSELDQVDIQLAVIVRELSKNPEIILIDRPGDLVTDRRFQVVRRVLEEFILKSVPLVFTSGGDAFFRKAANRHLVLAEGCLRYA